jgi:hypothetical protein
MFTSLLTKIGTFEQNIEGLALVFSQLYIAGDTVNVLETDVDNLFGTLTTPHELFLAFVIELDQGIASSDVWTVKRRVDIHLVLILALRVHWDVNKAEFVLSERVGLLDDMNLWINGNGTFLSFQISLSNSSGLSIKLYILYIDSVKLIGDTINADL